MTEMSIKLLYECTMWYCMLTDAINVLKETLYSQGGIKDII